MHWQEYVDRIVRRIEVEPGIEGAFLGGSLVTGQWDEFSDIDLGIATRNCRSDLEHAFSLRHELAALIGRPEHRLEKQWDHSLQIALLFGRSDFPPIGFELDMFFSRLRHVAELMPGASFQVVFDRSGRLREKLDELSLARQDTEVRTELLEQMQAFPFDAYHAAKALARGDLFNYQFVLERMRAAVSAAAASREGTVIRGSKRASCYLGPEERETVQRSYHEFTPDSITQLVETYLRLLAEVQQRYALEGEVLHLERALPRILSLPVTSPSP